MGDLSLRKLQSREKERKRKSEVTGGLWRVRLSGIYEQAAIRDFENPRWGSRCPLCSDFALRSIFFSLSFFLLPTVCSM